MKRAEELERFKTEINLSEYAQSIGYQIDHKKSSQNCLVMKDNQGDKILIGLDQNDNHYFYYSVKDNQDKGSIIDLIQKRKNLNLGQIRKELRPWINHTYSANKKHTNSTTKKPLPKLTPTSANRHKIIAQLESCQPITHHPYLSQRCITTQTLTNPRFEPTIYSDSNHNLIFPHHDRDGICGYYILNQNFKGFSSGGTKGLWCSQAFQTDKKLVICESPIDCLSYHQLFPNNQTRYFATSGTLSEKQKDLLTGAFEKIHALKGEIIIATDRDEAGNKLALELKNFAPKTASIFRHVPEHQKDWNEALQAKIAWERQQHNQPKRAHGRGLSR